MHKNDSVSWSESARLTARGFKTLYRISPRFMALMTIRSAWLALTPYVIICLSSLVIEELAGERKPERLVLYVLLTLFGMAAVSLGSALIDYRGYLAVDETKLQRFPAYFAKKLLDLDFASMDDTQTYNLSAAVRQLRVRGNGLTRLWWLSERMVQNLFVIIGGIAFSVTLFTRPVSQAYSGYLFLNHPLFLIGLIGIMAAVMIVLPLLSEKANEKRFFMLTMIPTRNQMHEFWTSEMLEKQNAADVRMYGQQQFGKQYFRRQQEAGRSGEQSYDTKGNIFSAAFSGASMIINGIIYTFICLKAWAGAFGAGPLTRYVAVVTKLTAGIAELVECIGYMKNNAAFLKTEFAYLDIPNRMYQGSLPVEKRDDNEYEFAFHNVSFKYPGSEEYALRNVSFQFKVGSRLAVVGVNGSGKTTMIKLLCRFYDPTEGEITLNGINIRKYRYHEYQNIFSVVFQDFHLFSYRLGENVAGEVGYDRQKARECLEKAGFGDRLRSLPDGMDTFIFGDFNQMGVDITEGEAQKIALARALYKDAPFVILDEPTAALDPVAEAEIYSKFNDIVGGKTTIYISHRLSSCRFCDEIVVFDHGEIVEHGSHEKLVAMNGKYRELWNAQAQYYV